MRCSVAIHDGASQRQPPVHPQRREDLDEREQHGDARQPDLHRDRVLEPERDREIARGIVHGAVEPERERDERAHRARRQQQPVPAVAGGGSGVLSTAMAAIVGRSSQRRAADATLGGRTAARRRCRTVALVLSTSRQHRSFAAASLSPPRGPELRAGAAHAARVPLSRRSTSEGPHHPRVGRRLGRGPRRSR